MPDPVNACKCKELENCDVELRQNPLPGGRTVRAGLRGSPTAGPARSGARGGITL
ncbi:hypothetical protein [Actinomadura opuntiae]|uniref:hypothetical protein n=1 Tax=Actinomadura sp. OS1-43 TaxID=604315 RepID=UPI00255B214E|nr:hypothetical protein [Actinomadura sp. OS1-43]MDL4815415.1 hypothetical protein [Actinomadura sp. OS1-43]